MTADTPAGSPPGDDLLAEPGVEVGVAAGSKEGTDYVITVRNGNDPGGPALVFTPSEWDAFVAGVKDGEFDLGDEAGR